MNKGHKFRYVNLEIDHRFCSPNQHVATGEWEWVTNNTIFKVDYTDKINKITKSVKKLSSGADIVIDCKLLKNSQFTLKQKARKLLQESTSDFLMAYQ